MLQQRVLDFGWPDAIAGGGNHVILAADVPEIAVAILDPEIAGQQKVACEFFYRGIRVLPVLDHRARVGLTHTDDAALTLRQLLAALIDDADVEARRGPPHRARPDREQF